MSVRIQKLPALSVFFPAYNEAGNIEEVVKQALAVLPTVAAHYEVIVVNDGSKDGTLQIARRLSKKYKRVRVANQRNKGYGGALKRGFKEAKYDWIFFTDADLQFDIAELKKFVAKTAENDLVLGYRLNRAEGMKRQILANTLKIWNRLLLGFPRNIQDIDCGFKLIHRRVLYETGPLLSDGAMVSTELLLKAYRADFRFAQIGVRHYQRRIGEATGSNTKVILKAVRDTFRLQWQMTKQELNTGLSNLAFSLRSSYTE